MISSSLEVFKQGGQGLLGMIALSGRMNHLSPSAFPIVEFYNFQNQSDRERPRKIRMAPSSDMPGGSGERCDSSHLGLV